ncbi:MAG: hypothetical protein YFSK_4710 [Candidatus Yanofskyibacterium parasiticum]|nr:MAG: hypothetical protein YFSK_4710 [Candidatus Yanofskybacteria bacterium]
MIDLFNRGQRLRQPGTEALDFIFYGRRIVYILTISFFIVRIMFGIYGVQRNGY